MDAIIIIAIELNLCVLLQSHAELLSSQFISNRQLSIFVQMFLPLQIQVLGDETKLS